MTDFELMPYNSVSDTSVSEMEMAHCNQAARNKEGILKTAPAEVMKLLGRTFCNPSKYTIPKGQQCTTVNPRSSPCRGSE